MEADSKLVQALIQARKDGDDERAMSVARIIASQHEEARVAEREPAEEFDPSAIPSKIAPSTANYIADTAKALWSPVDTLAAIAQTGIGAVSKIPMVGDTFPALKQYEPMADAVGDFYGERYGSVDALGRTVTNDPVGALADATGVGGLIPKVGKAAMAVNPANLMYNSGKKAVQKMIPEDFAAKQYQSAVNFDTVTSPMDKQRMVDAALEYGILPNEAGLDKAMAKIAELGDKIRLGVSGAEGTVPAQAIFSGVNDVRKELGGTKIEAPRDLRLVNSYVARYNRYLSKAGFDELNATQLQDLKQSVWGEIYSDRVKQKSFKAVDKTREAIGQKAGALVEELAPGTKALNLQQGGLLELMKQLPKKAQRIANRNNVSLQAGTNTTAGYLVGKALDMPVLGTAVGAGLAFADMPIPKARMAIMAHRMKNNADIMTTNRALPTLIREMGVNLQRYEREEEDSLINR
jgi:hypothetical protein